MTFFTDQLFITAYYIVIKMLFIIEKIKKLELLNRRPVILIILYP